MGTSAYLKYAPDCTFNGKATLNLGCGMTKFKAPNVVNLDAYDVCEPDVLHDLDSIGNLPFEDESFDYVLANHIMEHLRDFWHVFNECARILKPKGRIEIWVPGNGNDGIFGYRDHVRQINACSFFGTFANFTQGGNAWAEAHSRGHCNRMKLIAMNKAMISTWWIRLMPHKMRMWAAEHLRNVVIEQSYVFIKVTEEEFEKELRKHESRQTDNSVYLREVL